MGRKKQNGKVKVDVNVTQQKQTNKKTGRKKKRRGSKGSVGSQGAPLTRHFAMSMADPFSYSACVPDGSRGTGCFSVRDTGTLGTGAGGACCGIILGTNPGTQVYIDTASTSVSPTVTGNWAQAAKISVISGMFTKVRCVSAAIKITYIGNTQTDAGLFVGCQVNGGVPIANLNTAALNVVAAVGMWYKTIPVRNGIMVVWRPEDVEDVAQFQGLNPSSTVSTLFPQPYLVAYAYGLAANLPATLQYEYIVNYEGQFSSQQFMGGGSDPAKPLGNAEPGWYEKALNMLPSEVPITPLINGMIDVGARFAANYSGGLTRAAISSLSNGMGRMAITGVNPRRLL